MNNNVELGFEEDVDWLPSKYLELLGCHKPEFLTFESKIGFTVDSWFCKQISLLVF